MDDLITRSLPVRGAQSFLCASLALFSVRRNYTYFESEESIDWVVPYLDLVHHSPDALTLDYENCPVPLFNLFFHDCLILPGR